jgi:hypothetical protein
MNYNLELNDRPFKAKKTVKKVLKVSNLSNLDATRVRNFGIMEIVRKPLRCLTYNGSKPGNTATH